jgi:DNA-binding LytR/AlgR family response regulator
MIKIAIAEPSQSQRESLRKMLAEFGRENSAELEIHEYETGAGLIEDLWNGFNIILLDHEMRGQSGMETARALRRRDKNLVIIFISSQNNLWEDGFEVGLQLPYKACCRG